MECPACGERFDEHFDPDQDQWINLDSVIGPGTTYNPLELTSVVGDLIYHLKCIDADQLQNIVDQDQLGTTIQDPNSTVAAPTTPQDQNEVQALLFLTHHS